MMTCEVTLEPSRASLSLGPPTKGSATFQWHQAGTECTGLRGHSEP